MTTQEAYEQIRAWLARPGAERAYDTDMAQCAYITTGGNKCAIGGILPPELLHQLDGAVENVAEIIRDYKEIRDYFEGVDIEFLGEAQGCHDQPGDVLASENPKEWQRDALLKLDHTAQRYGLEVVKP